MSWNPFNKTFKDNKLDADRTTDNKEIKPKITWCQKLINSKETRNSLKKKIDDELRNFPDLQAYGWVRV